MHDRIYETLSFFTTNVTSNVKKNNQVTKYFIHVDNMHRTKVTN